jgi:hypothetical protein
MRGRRSAGPEVRSGRIQKRSVPRERGVGHERLKIHEHERARTRPESMRTCCAITMQELLGLSCARRLPSMHAR